MPTDKNASDTNVGSVAAHRSDAAADLPLAGDDESGLGGTAEDAAEVGDSPGAADDESDFGVASESAAGGTASIALMPLSNLRRSLGSFAVLLILLILVAENLPSSHIKQQLAPVLPVTNALGLRQEWGVFSPNPARVEVNTFARVRFDDGGEMEWYPPGGNGWLETNSAARWQKWSDRIRLDGSQLDWPTNAQLIADDVIDDVDRESRSVDTVELVREWSEGPLPGDGFEREYQEFTFYRYNVNAGTGEVLDGEDPANASFAQAQAEASEQVDSDPAEEGS